MSLSSPLLAGQILERIATEFNQLQFHAVQSKGMPLLDKVRPVSVQESRQTAGNTDLLLTDFFLLSIMILRKSIDFCVGFFF